MTITGQRHSVKFPTQRMRVAVEERRSGTGWVVRVIQPSEGQTVAIRSALHGSWDSARDAFVHEVITMGDDIMEDTYARLKQALRIWTCGRVGIRAGSGAAFNLVLAASANIVDVALPCARTIRTLMDSGGLQAGSFVLHDWLACALTDLQEGLTAEEAGRRLAVSMRG